MDAHRTRLLGHGVVTLIGIMLWLCMPVLGE
jgi:hypothetical protein